MRVFVVTSFDYGVGHSRPLCAFEAGVDAHRHASEQDQQEDAASDEHRVTELVLVPEIGAEPIPTRDELRELREKAGKWDAVLDATNFGLVDAEMVNHIAAHGAKWPRKASP